MVVCACFVSGLLRCLVLHMFVIDVSVHSSFGYCVLPVCPLRVVGSVCVLFGRVLFVCVVNVCSFLCFMHLCLLCVLFCGSVSVAGVVFYHCLSVLCLICCVVACDLVSSVVRVSAR